MKTDCRPTVREHTDVVIAGGGAAGVAAATTLARRGFAVILVERYGFCGGGAVAGLSGTICGMYLARDGVHPSGEPIVGGFLAEFVNRLEARGGLTDPVQYGKTYTRVHDPLVWRETADDFLSCAGVRVLFHALVTDVLLEGGERIAGVIASTKSGPVEIRARITIDATGDADVVAAAGLPFTEGDGGRVQNPTMMFRLCGVDTRRFAEVYGTDSIMPQSVTASIEAAQAAGTHRLPRSKIFLFPTPRPGELLCNATRLVGKDGRELNGARAEDLSEAEFQGRQQVREYARFIRATLEGCAESWVNDTGVQVGIRQTRSVTGVARLLNDDVKCARKRSDGIARSAWPIELHAGGKPELHWLLNDFYEIPYGAFVPQRGESLLVAGRCLSAEHQAMASARVTAQCFAYGEAIGCAAALALREKLAPRSVPGEEVRRTLAGEGALL